MLHDIFICHASEDKEAFVRPLAEALKAHHIEVWYDEFSLKLGDSIRQTIDKGLRQSRFGIIVLSDSFFSKKWTQYELDGLNELQMQGNDTVLLPIWHNITHAQVLSFSPPLAGRKAALSSRGLDSVLKEVLNIVRPQESPFITARDVLLEWGVAPPVITDEYWLDVVEASNRIEAYGAAIPEESTWGIWSFPLPGREGGPKARGERLAWTALQLRWTQVAERLGITPLTAPAQVLEFIESSPGLLETCQSYPQLVAEYAPQLTIVGFEGDLEDSIEEAYVASCERSAATAISSPEYGTLLTRDARPPLCDEEWSARHPTFGNLIPSAVAHAYFGGGTFGPTVSPYHHADHLFWLLSTDSKWLPKGIHETLLDGLKTSPLWLWTDGGHRTSTTGLDALFTECHDAIDEKRPIVWTESVTRDVATRIASGVMTMKLRDSPEAIMDAFRAQDLPGQFIKSERRLRDKRSKRTEQKKSTK